MAHEKLKKQYEKDREKYGKDAYKFWEYKNPYARKKHFSPLNNPPVWMDIVEYRRIEPIAELAFEPECFSGLNWRDAEKLVGKVVEFSDDPDDGWGVSILGEIKKDRTHKFAKDLTGTCWTYIRTCPETYAQPTSKNFKLHDTVLVYDRYRFATPLKAEILEFSSSNDGVRLRLLESNHPRYPVGHEHVWVHEAQLHQIAEREL